MLNDRREEQKIIEVVQALILARTALFLREQIISSPGIILRVMPFPSWNSMLSDPQLQSAVDVPHFPTADAVLADSEPSRKGHGDDDGQI